MTKEIDPKNTLTYLGFRLAGVSKEEALSKALAAMVEVNKIIALEIAVLGKSEKDLPGIHDN